VTQGEVAVAYESYYGFSEKPFGPTPDPKFLFRSESHTNAIELLQYAIQRREGFVVMTGDTGMGKTTLCFSTTSAPKRICCAQSSRNLGSFRAERNSRECGSPRSRRW
jgi:type II secretory pathway predicted ATPase ExeA